MGKWFAPLGKLVASGLAAVVLLSGCTSRDAGGGDLIGLEIEPQALQLAAGTSAPLTATALYANGAKEDITGLVDWLSANPAVATVSNAAGSSGRVSGVEVGSTQITASYEGVEASANVEVTPAIITALAISPNPASVPKGITVQLVATAVFSDGSTQNITADADWTSAAPAVAAVGNDAASKGRLTGVEFGQTTISASFQSLNAAVQATVTAAQATAIEVSPATPSIAKGTTQPFTATAVLSDGTTQDVTTAATWTSSNGVVAQVSNAAGTQGRAQGLQVGSAQITATFQSRSGSATLTVTAAELTGVQISPLDPSVPKGASRQFTATAQFSDGSTQNVTADATWTSSNTNVATISNAAGSSGLAQSKAQGETAISFTYGGRSASTKLTVTAVALTEIQVTPASQQIPVGRTQQYTATGVYSDGTTQNLTGTVTWSSSSSAVIEVSNAASSRGLAAAKAVGTATISAAQDGTTGSTGVQVTSAALDAIQISPTNAQLAVSFKRNYVATGVYSDGSSRDITNDVLWQSSNTSIATISNSAGSKGLATGVAAGTVSITASLSGQSRSAQLTVTTATLERIDVTPSTKTIPLGTSQQYSATAVFDDNSTQDLTTQVSWTSSDPTIATISNSAGSKGKAQAVKAGGPVTITATYEDASRTASLTVSDAALVSITVKPPTASLPKGKTLDYEATGTYTDSTTKEITDEVTWSSSNTGAATISNADGSRGRATAQNVGSATITATQGNISGSAQLTVTNAVLESITVTSDETGPLPKGRKRQFKATGTYSDNTVRTITAEVLWASSTENVATISNAQGEKGRAEALNAGTTTISASLDGVSGNAQLQVSNAVLESLAITPANPTVPAGLQQQMTATGTFSDGSIRSVTADVTWTSSNTNAVDISNSAGSKGLAFAKAKGSATIEAADEATGIKATTTFNVSDAVLQSISVEPADDAVVTPVQIPVTFGVQFRAMGTYSDSVEPRDITNDVSWSTLQPTTVSVGNGSTDKGYAKAGQAGTTTIVAALAGKTGTAPVTAVAATLNALAVTPRNATVAVGGTRQFTATGSFSNGRSYNVTREVTWVSSQPTFAEISNSEGSEGRATGRVPGQTTISATSGSVNDSTTLTTTAP